MMHHLHILVLFFFLPLIQGQSSDGIYTVIAPKTIRPNSRYNVGVSVDSRTPVKVLVYLTATINSRLASTSNEERLIEPGTSSIITLAVGDLIPGAIYNLTVQGTDGLRFQNSTQLTTNSKTASILIQTDKPIYKPGETLQFRVLLLDRLLRPYGPGPIDILIRDSASNVIKKWTGVSTSRGLFVGSLPISAEPNLGDWSVEVIFKTQREIQTVTIAEYVLPKFNVEIQLPPFATFSSSAIVARIRSSYTYGKAVRGEVVVAAYPSIHSSYIQPVFNGISRKTVPIDGMVDVTFDLTKELGLTDDYLRVVTVEATVRESFTGRLQNASKSITLHKYPYKIEVVSGKESFKPGLPYRMTLKVSTQDDMPVQDPNPNGLQVRYGFSYNHEEYAVKNYPIPSSGLVGLVFDVPNNASVKVFGLEATYKDLTEWFPTIQRALSPSNSYLQAVVLTKNPQVWHVGVVYVKVNDEIEIEVRATVGFETLNYQLLGRGDLAVARIVPQGAKVMRTAFRVRLPPLASPQATLIVYIVHEGEVVADSAQFHVGGSIDNFLNVTLSAKELEPGKDLEIQLSSKPNSVVALSGIDQSVLLLKAPKDLSLASLEAELNSWNYAAKEDESRFKRSLYSPIGSSTAAKVFEDAGVVILTNAVVHEQPPAVYYRANFLDDASINPEAEADSSSSPTWQESPLRVRKFFPETFLWEDLNVGYDGKASLRRTVPDTITSWILSGFSLDSSFGLGVLESAQTLKVFRPFFISFNVPYAVVRGETVGIQVLVHNYLGRDITAKVTLDNSANQFAFVQDENEVESKLELFKSEQVEVKSNSVGSVSFLVSPTKVGLVDLNVRAQTRLAGDAVTRPLKVKPPGHKQNLNTAGLLDLRTTRSASLNFTTKFPLKRVPDSDSVKVSIVSDILGPAITNLEKLLELPTGCGEQNMIHFVPDILVLDYLQATRQVNDAIQEQALKYLEVGYQRQLSYKHEDGSFSAFGSSDPTGSTWLTAFVVRSFIAAKKHIFIDKDVIDKGLNWLISKQERSGRFPEIGRVFDTEIQGGSSTGIALTAYVTLALVEAEMDRTLDTSNGRFSLAKNIAMDYIVKELQGLEDPYAISIVAYLLQLSSHPFQENVFNIMETKATLSEDADMKHWERPKTAVDAKNPWTANPKPIAVETTSYALLCYTHRNLITDSLPVVRWLLTQRNAEGGFLSTQDTIVGLTALTKFATSVRSGPPDMSVRVVYPGGTHNLKLNQNNAIVLDEIQLPASTPWVHLTATGTGIGIAQLSSSYNLDVSGPWPLFSLDPQVDKSSNSNQLHLSICTHASTDEESNMAVMEVNVPTGYALNTDRLPNLLHYPEIKRYDTTDQDSKLVVYFSSLNKSDVCPTVSAYRVFPVAKQAPAFIQVYDYYDNSRRARQFYSPPTTRICDICDEAQCSEECRVARLAAERERSDGPDTLSSAIKLTSGAIPVLLIITLCYHNG